MMKSNLNMLPLDGLRVIDLTHAGAGPYATMLLADLGADIIKVEPKKGDIFRNIYAGALTMNLRNKRSIAVDLKTEEGKEILKRLVKNADVLVESFTPGTLERMGFGFDDVGRINPQIVYCSLSGFGHTGPYARKRAFDPVIQAMCGNMASTGEPDGEPVRTAGSFIDFGTGALLAFSILSALILRDKTGKAQKVDISLFDTAVSFMGYWITYYALTGELPEKMGTAYKAYAPYKLFKTRTKPIYICVYDDKTWNNFCNALGFENLKNNPKYSTNENRCRNREELERTIEEYLSKMDCEEVFEKLSNAGVPCGPMLTVADLFEHPQVLARNMIIKLKHPAKQIEFEAAGIPVKIQGIEERIRYQPPKIGEHTLDVLREIGYTEDEISELKLKGIVLVP